MTASNSTPAHNLPLFVASDKPTWLGDWNAAMSAIDEGLVAATNTASNVATTAANALAIANTAKTTADNSITDATSALGTAATARTEAQAALNAANAATSAANDASSVAASASNTANTASTTATNALNTANANANLPATWGKARLSAEITLGESLTALNLVVMNSAGMTQQSGGLRVDKAGVYLIECTIHSVADTEGLAEIAITRGGSESVYQSAYLPPSWATIHIVTIGVLQVNDIIKVMGQSATFAGGTSRSCTLNVYRIGA